MPFPFEDEALEQDMGFSTLTQAVLGEIHERYYELFGMAELANEMMVNKSHLIRLFSREVGVPPGKYLVMVKINHVKTLLLEEDYTMDNIANICGFSCGNYMCRVFKKETGQTPSSFKGGGS